ncbi:MAG: DUF349 domain-containing protein [Prevotella sp.]|nr:DUF349 domain-containing protein [Prevotella sp.]
MDSQDTALDKRLYATKEEVLERVKQLAHGEEEIQRAELDHLKTAYYYLLNAERDAAQKAYLEAGGDPMQYIAAPDPTEEEFKAEMQLVKERKQADAQRQEAEKQANLKRKLEIIDKIKSFIDDSANETEKSVIDRYKEVKALQEEWKEIKAVPAENATSLWNNYKLVLEQYYDLLKLNFEAREYDFKKNLEAKTALCEAAEKLADEPDVVSAFHSLQELHNQFREIGPVAKELREEIWNRFKQASTVVNKRHADHFEALHQQEEQNLEKKTALCEKVEDIVSGFLNDQTTKQPNDRWDALAKEIIAIQAEWKTIGFAPKAMNVKIFERFRTACDQFFSAKNEYYQQLKGLYAENIAKKEEIVKKAQELADSTEWKATADRLIQLQKDWKEIGMTPRKVGEQLWTDFRAACDKFFEARKASTANTRNEQQDNLQKKQSVIERLKALIEAEVEDLNAEVQALTEEYSQIGHVPFRAKDDLFREYHDTLDELYKKIRKARNAASGRAPRVDTPDSLQRRYNEKKEELATYENNLLFLSSSSKKGNSLIDTMNRKVEKLREELAQLKEQIKAAE